MKNGVITDSQPAESNRLFPSLVLSTATAIVYFFSNPKPQNYYDYTFRVAGNLLRGAIGFSDKPPSWLNEFVPFEGEWYSVFPFGAVVTTNCQPGGSVSGISPRPEWRVSVPPARIVLVVSVLPGTGVICLPKPVYHGVEIENRLAGVATLRDGKMVRGDLYLDIDEACRVAGIER